MAWLVWHSRQFVFDRRQSDSIIPALSDPFQTIRRATVFSVFLKKICWNGYSFPKGNTFQIDFKITLPSTFSRII
jgi:hypothetical protein